MTTTKNNEHKKLNVPNKQEQNQTCLDSAEREGLRPKGNVPNLRFPEFQGEWEKCRLGDVCTFLSGGTPKIDAKEYWNGTIPFVSAISMHDTYILDSKLHISEEGLKHGSRLLTKDNLLLLVRGSMLWNTIPICLNKNDVAFNQDVKGIIANDTINNEFLLYWLKSKEQRLKYMVTGTGLGAGKLDTSDLLSMIVYIPAMKEQDKVARLLSLFDERIATQNKIIEDLKKLKSAIIEKLYKGIQGTWYSYRQLFSIINERNKQLEYSNVLSASQERGMVSREDLNLYIHFERSNISTYKIVKNGDYVIHLRSFQGGFAFSEQTGICSPAYTVLRPNNLLVYGYLSNYFISRDFVKSLIIVTYGIRDGRSINVDEWLDMKVVIPSKEQQTHIVNVIESIENKIKNEETYSNCLLNQKQYMLRQMFI